MENMVMPEGIVEVATSGDPWVIVGYIFMAVILAGLGIFAYVIKDTFKASTKIQDLIVSITTLIEKVDSYNERVVKNLESIYGKLDVLIKEIAEANATKRSRSKD